ncbi:MAG: MarP family serine protease [Candidatus Saccharimonadales bacterium]
MNIVDILIILLLISSMVRGSQIGMIRQAGSTIGFIGGLFLGSFISSHTITSGHVSAAASLIGIIIVLIISFGLLSVGEYIGIKLKTRLMRHRIDVLDGGLGAVMGVATLLLGLWLIAAMVVLSPQLGLQSVVKQSRIINSLNRSLPPVTKFFGVLNRLIDPNGFPQVFSGLEPSPKHVELPPLGELKAAVLADQASVVKIEGTGCGGIVEGSGFVYAKNRVVTNAHVVAGVRHPQIWDKNGIHDTRVVWFDSKLDLAVLEVSQLAGKPLTINQATQPTGTPAAVVGYPGGGDFTAQPASVLDHFLASGRDIYDQGRTERQIYSVQSKVVPGNSGGPLIAKDGSVLGVVFATSTTYNDVGYVLTSKQVSQTLDQAVSANKTVPTSSCSE